MMKYIQQIQDIQSKWFLVVMAMLPFPQPFIKWAILIWFGLWLIEGRWLHRPKPLRDNRILIPLLCFGLWYGLKIVSGLWAEDSTGWHHYIENHATFVALIPIGIWGVNSRYHLRHALSALIIGCLAVAFLYPFTLYWVHNHEYFLPRAGWGELHSMNWEWYADKISYLKHRLFLCSVEIAGIIAVVYQYPYYCQRMGRVRATLMSAAAIGVMLTLILSTGSRQSLLSITALAIVSAWALVPQRLMRTWGIGIIAAIAVVGTITFLQHPRMQSFNKQEITHFMQTDDSHDIRLNIWGFALSTPQDYLAYGLGAGQSATYLSQKFDQVNWDHYQNQGYNSCHNQYLEELIENGIAGLIWFVLCWGVLIICCDPKSRLVAILLTTLYGLNMCTDVMFGRYDGIALWSVWVIVLIMLQSAHTSAASTPENDKEVSR